MTKVLRNFKILFTISFLLIFLLRISPTKESTTTVKVDPDVISASLNETFTINITILDVQNLYAIEISLSWNETILQLTSVEVRLNINESHPDGVLYGPVYWENETSPNKYSLWGTSYNQTPPFYGSGNIVRLTFTVRAAGNCTFDLESKLYDWPPPDRVPRISQPIDHITLDGVFVIPEFSSFLIVMLLLSVIAAIITAIIIVFRNSKFLKKGTQLRLFLSGRIPSFQYRYRHSKHQIFQTKFPLL